MIDKKLFLKTLRVVYEIGTDNDTTSNEVTPFYKVKNEKEKINEILIITDKKDNRYLMIAIKENKEGFLLKINIDDIKDRRKIKLE